MARRRFAVRSAFRALVCTVLCGGLLVSSSFADDRSAVDRSPDLVATASGPSDDFLQRYAETFRFRLGYPSSVEITPDGDAVLFLRSGGRSFVRDLYLFDPATGTESKLLTAEEILGGVEEELTDEEKARRERMRLAARGIAGYSLSGDGTEILAPLSGRLFVVDRSSKKARELTVEGGFPIDPRFSPGGEAIAYVADGDLYVIDVEADDATRLTTRTSETVTNGLPEFVAQEEMDRDHGYWFSPDGSKIAYQRTDVDGVETFYIPDPADPGKAPQSWPYPRPGKTNASVRLGVIAATGGETVWVDWDRKEYPYLATVRWQKDAPLTILVQDRHQQEQVLYAVDDATGAVTELLRETDDAWLNLDQSMPLWLPGGERFLWTTERRGAWQLELRAADGSLVREVTPLDFGYAGFQHLDADEGTGGAVYVTAAQDPTQSHIWRLPLDGRGKGVQLTEEPGMHGIQISDNGSLQIVKSATLDAASRAEVRRADGTVLGVLGEQAEDSGLDLQLEFVEVGEDPSFHSVVVRPEGFDPSLSYPVILQVYGGPHAQTVTKTGTRYTLNQWIANQGYIVVSIDGRGTPRRGRAWERTIRGNFIDQPLADQVTTLKALGERFPEMDLERVGVFGWSFGGYFSAMATMRHPELFDAGVAGAPVTDWQDYDTHYTERYIGLPQEDPEAYEVSNVLTYADQLEKPLLIIHGTADDNVYFVHALKMSDALLRAGKDHEFLTLSGHTHMVTEPAIVERMYRRIMDFFHENLGDPAPRQATAR
ncbi:MAG: DPP IV N-terminal domain-containing protein [Acidobacteriota bacterium]